MTETPVNLTHKRRLFFRRFLQCRDICSLYAGFPVKLHIADFIDYQNIRAEIDPPSLFQMSLNAGLAEIGDELRQRYKVNRHAVTQRLAWQARRLNAFYRHRAATEKQHFHFWCLGASTDVNIVRTCAMALL